MINKGDSRPDPWTQVWQALTSNRLLALWLGLLGLAALVTLWFPQAPRSVYHQNGGLESWLAAVGSELGSPADTLLALGLLTVANSAWFRLLLVGLGLLLLLRVFDAAQGLIHFPNQFEPSISQKLQLPAQAPAALEAVEVAIRTELERGIKFRREDEPQQRLVAHRPLASLGPLCAALGGLIVLAGWLWTHSAGWELARLRLAEEMSITVPTNGQVLHMDALQVQWGNNGAPTAALGKLTLWTDAPVASGEVSLAKKWRWRGVTYRLTGVGPAVQVKGRNASGEPLSLQTAAHRPPAQEVTLLLPAEEGPRSFAAPDEGIVIQAEAVTPEPQVRLRVYQGRAGELVEDRTISKRASFELDGARFNMSVTPFAEINASYTPGRPLVIAGIVLAGLGIALAFGFPPRQLQVIVGADKGGSEVIFHAARPNDLAWLTAVIEQLDAAQKGAGNRN